MKVLLVCILVVLMFYVIVLLVCKIFVSDEMEQCVYLLVLGVVMVIVGVVSMVGGLFVVVGVVLLDGSILIWVFLVLIISYSISYWWIIICCYGGFIECDEGLL